MLALSALPDHFRCLHLPAAMRAGFPQLGKATRERNDRRLGSEREVWLWKRFHRPLSPNHPTCSASETRIMRSEGAEPLSIDALSLAVWVL